MVALAANAEVRAKRNHRMTWRARIGRRPLRGDGSMGGSENDSDDDTADGDCSRSARHGIDRGAYDRRRYLPIARGIPNETGVPAHHVSMRGRGGMP